VQKTINNFKNYTIESGVLNMTLLVATTIVVPFTAIKLGIKKNEKKAMKK
jgi:hypothetical protein